MTTEQEIQSIADEVSRTAPALAVRLRALAARVAHQERVLDELADEGIHVARLAWQERKRAAEVKRTSSNSWRVLG
jgi:hypothetical protein